MSSSSAASSESPLHIISWNVAGWIPTLKHIVARHGSLGAFLRRHQIDVLALQESKVPPKTLSNASDHQPDCEGYDSYWAPCRIPGSSFNGVAVYARRGLVRAAHRDVLGDSEFDDEGRCIRIDIGGRLVLFNVYVPNSGSTSQRSDYKVRYLARLRWAMAKVRESGTPVMLVGDYNIARRVHDRDWRHRSADIQAMLDAPLGGGGGRGGGGGEGGGRRSPVHFCPPSPRPCTAAAAAEGAAAAVAASAAAAAAAAVTMPPSCRRCFASCKRFGRRSTVRWERSTSHRW